MYIVLGCKGRPLWWSKCIALKWLRTRRALRLLEGSVVGWSGRVREVVGHSVLWRVEGPIRRRMRKRVGRTCILRKVWDTTCAPVWTFTQGPLGPVGRDAIKRAGRASQMLGYVERVWWCSPIHL